MRKEVLAAVMLSVSSAVTAQTTAGPDDGVPIFFLADSQIHNVYGTSLKQMFPAADRVSRVAIRPPEVNLLAPLTLRHALDRADRNAAGDAGVVVVLGDGTNIGCSGEADEFDAEFARLQPRVIRLMAHGNHDTYMMGTVNSYVPTASTALSPLQMTTSALPVDEAWWHHRQAPAEAGTSMIGRNWLDACFAPNSTNGTPSTPMNKVRWLARYAASLAPFGLVEKADGPSGDAAVAYSQSALPGSPLARLNYRGRGVFYRPSLGTGRNDQDYARSWNSFLVQAIDISPNHTLVLIDTSVRPVARGGLPFAWTNAGTRSRIGEEQFEVLRELLSNIPSERSVIVGGHFPLKALARRERKALIQMLRARPAGLWAYVSGHTHDHLTTTEYPGGVDVNIGSTTDWPMESHVVRFDAQSPALLRVDQQVLSSAVAPLDYTYTWDLAGRYSELCRHIGAARELAAAQRGVFQRAWASPTMDPEKCEAVQKDWNASAAELARYRAEISRRFDDELDYRDFVLRVAAGASRFEAVQRPIGTRRIP